MQGSTQALTGGDAAHGPATDSPDPAPLHSDPLSKLKQPPTPTPTAAPDATTAASTADGTGVAADAPDGTTGLHLSQSSPFLTQSRSTPRNATAAGDDEGGGGGIPPPPTAADEAGVVVTVQATAGGAVAEEEAAAAFAAAPEVVVKPSPQKAARGGRVGGGGASGAFGGAGASARLGGGGGFGGRPGNGRQSWSRPDPTRPMRLLRGLRLKVSSLLVRHGAKGRKEAVAE